MDGQPTTMPTVTDDNLKCAEKFWDEWSASKHNGIEQVPMVAGKRLFEYAAAYTSTLTTRIAELEKGLKALVTACNEADPKAYNVAFTEASRLLEGRL